MKKLTSRYIRIVAAVACLFAVALLPSCKTVGGCCGSCSSAEVSSDHSH